MGGGKGNKWEITPVGRGGGEGIGKDICQEEGNVYPRSTFIFWCSLSTFFLQVNKFALSLSIYITHNFIQ